MTVIFFGDPEATYYITVVEPEEQERFLATVRMETMRRALMQMVLPRPPVTATTTQ